MKAQPLNIQYTIKLEYFQKKNNRTKNKMKTLKQVGT